MCSTPVNTLRTYTSESERNEVLRFTSQVYITCDDSDVSDLLTFFVFFCQGHKHDAVIKEEGNDMAGLPPPRELS